MADNKHDKAKLNDSDIELDPITQGVGRVREQEEEDIRLDSTSGDEEQGTHTLANIHLGSRNEHGEGFGEEVGQAFPSSSTEDSTAVGSPVHRNIEQAEYKLSEFLREDQTFQEEPVNESAISSAGTATSALEFEPAFQTDVRLENTEAMPGTGTQSVDSSGGVGDPVFDPGPNVDPVAIDDEGSLDENETFSLNVLSNDTDQNNDSLFITDAAVRDGLGAVSHDGENITFNPGSAYDHLGVGETEDVTITYTLSDGEGGTDVAILTLTVTGSNDGPVVGNVDLGATLEDTTVTFTAADLLVNSSDVEGDSLSVSSVTVDATYGVVTDNGDGTYSFTPAENYNGTDIPLNFTVSDGVESSSATANIDVTAVNDGPVAHFDTFVGSEDQQISGNVIGNDTDVEGDTLSVVAETITTVHGGTVILNADGTFNYTPADDFNGTDSFSYSLSDGTTMDTGSVTFEVAAVNDAPVVTAGVEFDNVTSSLSLNEEGRTGDLAALSGLDDFPTDALTVQLSFTSTEAPVAGETNGIVLVSYAVPSSDNEFLIFAQSNGQLAVYINSNRIQLDVNSDDLFDGERHDLSISWDSNTGEISVFVDGSLADTATAQAGHPIQAGGTITLGQEQDSVGGGFVSAQEFSGEIHSLQIFSEALNPGDEGATPVLGFDFDAAEPLDNSFGDHAFVLDGGAYVTNVAEGTAHEDSSGISGRISASDIDGDNLAFELSTAPAEGTVTVGTDGSFNFVPGDDFQDLGVGESRDVTFEIQVSDGQGGSDIQLVTVTITGRNDGPVAESLMISISEDNGADGQLTALDVDGDNLSFTLSEGPDEGSVTLNGDGSFHFNPGSDFQDLNVGESRVVSFSYEVSDGNGSTDTGTATVTVTGNNDGPVAHSDAFSGTEDQQISGNVIDNDTDVEGDSLSVVAETITTVHGGTVILNEDGTFSYTPAADFNGTDSFSYTLSDGTTVDTGSVTLEVAGTNDGPVVGNIDLGVTLEDTTVTFTTADLLENSSDADGDVMSVSSVTVDAAYGIVTDNGNGTYSFTPAADYSGTDIPLNFTVSDGVESSSATANIDVTAVADTPTLEMTQVLDGNHGQYDISVGGVVTIDVSYLSVNAGYNSSHGFYIADSDGNPIGGAVIQDNVKDGGSKSITIDTDDYPGGVTVGFFIIPDGDDKNSGLSDGDAVTFQEIDGVWTPMDDGTAMSGQGAPAYFSNASLNPDGYDHFADTETAGNQNWEDLYNGGDHDFTDVNANVTVSIQSDSIAVQAEVGVAMDLPDISLALTDLDASETWALGISDIPDGAVLSDGNGNSFTATSGNNSVDVSSWSHNDLTVTPAEGSPDFNLQVTVTSTEGSNGDTATTSHTISVEIADQVIDGTVGSDDLQGAGGDDVLNYSVDGTWTGYNAHNVETGKNVALSGSNRTTDVYDGGDGYDTLLGTSGDDTLFLHDDISSYASGGQGRIQNIEEIDMGAGNDIVDMTSNNYTYSEGIIVKGGDGDDIIWTSNGDDSLIGGAGNDAMYGGQGSDLFIFESNEGNDTVSGGDNWIDAIQLEGFSATDSQQGWTLTLDGGDTIQSTDEDMNEMLLSEDASGTIVFDDGGTIDFDGIEKIIW
ncbi:MAG: tandem-95 repeat protein [Emcibacter sp.]|nr:tandem-95 repeat protein [Emcibacter sp.]